jgi:hypothetical protein
MTGFTPKTRALIYARDGGCVVCGHDGDLNIHHRTPRGMGGSKAPWVNRASNGISVCGSGVHGCHGRIEANRSWAEVKGYIVRRGLNLPVNVPVEHVRFGPVWLTDAGEAVPVDNDHKF